MASDHLYIHVPFCKTICAYCDFCHVLYKKEKVDLWLKRLSEEIKQCDGENYSTIYLGGGTPSCLDQTQLECLLKLVYPYRKKECEYTIEINPETMNDEKYRLLNKYGINRASIGLQSTDPGLLKLMNRHHSFDDVKVCIDKLREEGIDNISLDIMYSLPGQTMADLKDTLDKVLKLKVPHLSLYSLTIEENSIFGKLHYENLDPETEADMYEYIEKTLTDNSYQHYEVANFAWPGYESKHNLGYWRYEDYRGLSCGASGKIGHMRYDNTRDLDTYLMKTDIINERIELSPQDERFEHLMMSLRTKEGLDLKVFNNKYQTDFMVLYKDVLKKHQNNIRIVDDHVVVNDLAILNHILVDFLD